MQFEGKQNAMKLRPKKVKYKKKKINGGIFRADAIQTGLSRVQAVLKNDSNN